ncbi:VOC family protein [Lysobacter sp. A3-1-A15]|uniref:VOC family protein n=1 Tax=Novilysobacter viscosus TaxID=3098602 RepID=UPI002ED80C4A
MNLNQVTLPSHDVPACIAFYRLMGFTLIVDSSPRYARFECPEGDATFSLHHVDDGPSDSGVLVYFECDDLDTRVADLCAKGIAFEQMPADQGWLWREARLRDPSGNRLCLFHAGGNRRHPPWRVAA